ELATLNPRVKFLHEHPPSLFFSPDGLFLVCGAGLWDVPGRKFLHKLKGGRPTRFSPNSKHLVIGNHLWDVASGKRVGAIPPYFSFAPDGSAIFVRNGSVISRWDVRAGREQGTLDGHRMAFSSDGNRIVTGFRDTVRVWDAQSGKQLLTIKLKDKA